MTGNDDELHRTIETLSWLNDRGALAGAAEIIAERRRQAENGDGHGDGRLRGTLDAWLYEHDWDRQCLREAGALIAAEIDRKRGQRQPGGNSGRRAVVKVYLAGPMRGYEDMNRPAFAAAAATLRAAGHFVCNPAENEAGSLRANLAVDTSWIALVAEAVVLLPGWRASAGATAEHALASALGLPTLELEDFLGVTA